MSSLTIITIKGPFNEAFNCNIMIRDTTETIESGPLCITDLFQNKSVAYFLTRIILLLFLALYYVTFQCGRKNIFYKI